MPIVVKCPCGKQVELLDEHAGSCVECESCGGWLFAVLCSCGKLFAIQATHAGKRVRCPGCKELTVSAPPKPEPPLVEPLVEPWVEEGGTGTYGVAQESSLPYLLRRQETGHSLTREEKAAVKRLIAEKRKAHPRQCPGFETHLPLQATVCPSCELNLKTGQRPVKQQVEPAAYMQNNKGSNATSDPKEVGEAALEVLKAIADVAAKAGGS